MTYTHSPQELESKTCTIYFVNKALSLCSLTTNINRKSVIGLIVRFMINEIQMFKLHSVDNNHVSSRSGVYFNEYFHFLI